MLTLNFKVIRQGHMFSLQDSNSLTSIMLETTPPSSQNIASTSNDICDQHNNGKNVDLSIVVDFSYHDTCHLTASR